MKPRHILLTWLLALGAFASMVGNARAAGQWTGPYELGSMFTPEGASTMMTLCLGADTSPPDCNGPTLAAAVDVQTPCTFDHFEVDPATPPFFGNTGTCWVFVEDPPLLDWSDPAQVLQAMFFVSLVGLSFFGYRVGSVDA